MLFNLRCSRCPRLWGPGCSKLCRIWRPARSERSFPSGRSALGKTLESDSRRFRAGVSTPTGVQAFFSTFDVFGHGVHGVPVGVDGDQDGSQVGKRLDLICGKQNQSVKPPSGVAGVRALVVLPISSTTSTIFSSSSGQMSGQWVNPK